MKAIPTIIRRDFLKLSMISGTALVVGCLPSTGKEPKIVNLSKNGDPGIGLNPYIFIGEDGSIVLYNHRPEMGQGTFQAIPMILAEDLEVDINKIQINQSPADREKYGDQMVVGSRSIRSNFELMRKMGASARDMLREAASRRWQVEMSECRAHLGEIRHDRSGRRLSYGDLVKEAALLDPPSDPALKDPSEFRILGKPVHRMDIPQKTNGSALFGIDIKVPGMLYASVERSPVFLGKVVDFNNEKALAVPGVKYVLKTDREVWGQKREGVAVVAENYWAALEGRKALEITWDNGDLESWSTEKIKEDYKNATSGPSEIFEDRGDFDRNFSTADKKLEAFYETPYQTHAPMEPMNAIVSVSDEACEFWGSTQNPNGIRSHLSEKLGIAPEKVAIHYTFMGGGFGRRSLTDVVDEAADLSRRAGAPVKVIWTREDDLTQGPFRACSLNHLRGGIHNDGHLIALEHQVICQDIRNQTGNDNTPSRGITGGINTEYDITNFKLSGILRKFYISISYWRSVYHSTNCFAHESFMDELAHAAGKDPVEFRLSLLQDHARYTRVLKLAAEKSSWHQPTDETSGRGVAIVERSGSFVAMVAEVRRVEGRIRPVKITLAIDCGMMVNPDTIKAQSEGCVVMGLTACYKSGLTVEKGRIVEQNFDTYPMMELHETPEIEVHIVQNEEVPEGVGEAALPPTAPAVTNAIFALTGNRIRSLPFDLDEL
jgi:isoquinoline 1-oxidoreductase beta subunit